MFYSSENIISKNQSAIGNRRNRFFLFQSLQELDKIEVVGLMTMAPFTEEEKVIVLVLRHYVY